MRFEDYHPTINLIFFASVIFCTIRFQQPVFIALSYSCAFIYSVKLGGTKALIFNLALLPLIAGFAAFYAYYNHFGVTVLTQNFIDNDITLEALVYGGVIGVIAAAVMMWMSCVHRVFSTDKIIYLFGRISPKLSLFIAIALRLVPRVKARIRKTNTAQKGIGRGSSQGGFFRRCGNVFRQVSIIVTWLIENMVEVSDAMRCRGYGLRGRRAFSIYRFDHRDRGLVIAVFTCFTILMMGALFDQTRILYDPQIIMNRITPLSAVFYIAYAALCLMPFTLETVGEMRFKRQKIRD